MYYHNYSKFSDGEVWANSVDPDQTAPVCHSVCVLWTYYSMVKQHSSNCKIITVKPRLVALSGARLPGMQMVVGSILGSGNILLWRLVIRSFL